MDKKDDMMGEGDDDGDDTTMGQKLMLFAMQCCPSLDTVCSPFSMDTMCKSGPMLDKSVKMGEDEIPCGMMKTMVPKFTASKEFCASKLEGEDTTMKQNFDVLKGTCCSDGMSACDGLDSGASSPSPASSNASSNATSTPTGTVATVKQTSFAVTLPSIPAANFSGTDVAAKAKADYIAQKAASGTTIDPSKVTAVAETTVKTQVGL